jgi:hypothetical protein
VGPRAGLDDVKKLKLLPPPGLEPRTLGPPTRNQSLYGLRYPGSKLESVPLSNDVIRYRRVYITFDVLKQAFEELAASLCPFSMQLDDISQCSRLLVFVRYVLVDAIRKILIS